jgi:hypothetical protein
LKVFTAQDGIFASAVNLVATASKYGLIFVGCPTGIQGRTMLNKVESNVSKAVYAF